MPYSQPLWRRSRAKANKAIYAVGRHTVLYTLLCMLCHYPTEWTVMRLLLSSSALGGIRSDGPSSRQFWLTSQFVWLLPRPSSSARMCPLTVDSLRLVLECCCQNSVLCHRNICSLQLFMQEKLYFFFSLSVFHAVLISVRPDTASLPQSAEPYGKRRWAPVMSRVLIFWFLTYCYSLIKNPFGQSVPQYNGGFWPSEFKPFCLYSWCFLARRAETSCLFDASSVHTNVPLDNGSQLIHSFLWHTHTRAHTLTPCNLYNSCRYGDPGPVSTQIALYTEFLLNVSPWGSCHCQYPGYRQYQPIRCVWEPSAALQCKTVKKRVKVWRERPQEEHSVSQWHPLHSCCSGSSLLPPLWGRRRRWDFLRRGCCQSHNHGKLPSFTRSAQTQDFAHFLPADSNESPEKCGMIGKAKFW